MVTAVERAGYDGFDHGYFGHPRQTLASKRQQGAYDEEFALGRKQRRDDRMMANKSDDE